MLPSHLVEEEIPDDHSLFYRIHKTYIRDNDIPPNAMVAKGEGGMSTDWSKYSDAETLLKRAKNPADNAIVRFIVGEVRGLEGLSVKHRPIIENYSHSEVYGIPEKGPFKTSIRAQLANIAQWEIEVSK
jgi:hypothetical protein